MDLPFGHRTKHEEKIYFFDFKLSSGEIQRLCFWHLIRNENVEILNVYFLFQAFESHPGKFLLPKWCQMEINNCKPYLRDNFMFLVNFSYYLALEVFHERQILK